MRWKMAILLDEPCNLFGGLQMDNWTLQGHIRSLISSAGKFLGYIPSHNMIMGSHHKNVTPFIHF